VLNRLTTSAAAGAESRHQRYLRKVPCFLRQIPFLFWTQVIIVEDVRGPKGSLDRPRGSVGHVVSIVRSSYLIYRPDWGTTMHQHAVKALDENVLARSGLPSAVALHSVSTQTLKDNAPRAPLPPPETRAVPPPPPVVNIAFGAGVEVAWKTSGSSELAWFAGVIADSSTTASGRRHHLIRYTGFPEIEARWHDLASSTFEWRRLAPPRVAAAPPRTHATTRAQTAPHAASAAAGPRLDRLARRLERAENLTDAALDACPEHAHTARYNASLFQALGDESEPYECSTACCLDDARRLLHAGACGARPAVSPECSKATQNVVNIITPAGPVQERVPLTHRIDKYSIQRSTTSGSRPTRRGSTPSSPGQVIASSRSTFRALQASTSPPASRRAR